MKNRYKYIPERSIIFKVSQTSRQEIIIFDPNKLEALWDTYKSMIEAQGHCILQFSAPPLKLDAFGNPILQFEWIISAFCHEDDVSFEGYEEMNVSDKSLFDLLIYLLEEYKWSINDIELEKLVWFMSLAEGMELTKDEILELIKTYAY